MYDRPTIRLIYGNFHALDLSLADIRRLALTTRAWLWIWTIALCALFIQPVLPGISFPRLVRALVNIGSASLGQLVYLGFLALAVRYGTRFGLRTIFSPLPSFVAAVIFTHACVWANWIVAGYVAKGWTLTSAYTFDFILFEGQAALFGTFLLPTLLARWHAQDAADKATSAPQEAMAIPTDKLVVAARPFDAVDLVAVCANKKFVDVVTVQQSFRLRATFSDTLLKLASLDGMQVHRSYWVASAHVRGCRTDQDGRMVLQLVTGLEIMVSPSRDRRVREWLAGLGIAIP